MLAITCVAVDYCCCCVRQEGIKPMWEDGGNRKGGRWLINMSKGQHTDLDNAWLEIVSTCYCATCVVVDDVASCALTSTVHRRYVVCCYGDCIAYTTGDCAALVRFMLPLPCT